MFWKSIIDISTPKESRVYGADGSAVVPVKKLNI